MNTDWLWLASAVAVGSAVGGVLAEFLGRWIDCTFIYQCHRWWS